MNFVFISPNFPEAYRWFCVRLKENGVNVLGVGDAPYDFLHPDLKRALTEYYRVDSLEDYDQVLRAVGYFTGRYGKIDWLESNNEYWLELDARLRTDFHITTGPRAHEIEKYKSKLAMKEYYKKAGIPCARCAPVTDLDASLAFVREAGYPVVVKPDNGVGAVATWKLENEEDLRRFFQAPPEAPYLMEEYVSGSVTTYDGVCDSKGEVLFAASHVTRNSIMDMVNKHVPTYYYVDKEVPPDVEAAGKAALKAFGASSRFFHLEFFRLTEAKEGLGSVGDIVALEVNMRPAGGYTPDMMNYAHGTDVYQIWADMVTAERRLLPPGDAARFCVYASRRDGVSYVPTHEEILSRYGGQMVMCERMPEVISGAMGNQMYTAKAENGEAAREFAEFITERAK